MTICLYLLNNDEIFIRIGYNYADILLEGDSYIIMTNVKKKKPIYQTVLNVVFWLVLAVILLYSVTALFSDNEDGVSSFFGVSALSVQSPSMTPTFNKGDLIIVDVIGEDYDYSTILVDDVIVFPALRFIGGENRVVNLTHRVIEVQIDSSGKYRFRTQGDANSSPDPEVTTQDYVYAKWTGTYYAGLGDTVDSVLGFVKSPDGFLAFIVIPCFLFLGYEVFRFIKVMTEYNVQKATANRPQIDDEVLARARALIEAEMAKEKEEKYS